MLPFVVFWVIPVQSPLTRGPDTSAPEIMSCLTLTGVSLDLSTHIIRWRADTDRYSNSDDFNVMLPVHWPCCQGKSIVIMSKCYEGFFFYLQFSQQSCKKDGLKGINIMMQLWFNYTVWV